MVQLVGTNGYQGSLHLHSRQGSHRSLLSEQMNMFFLLEMSKFPAIHLAHPRMAMNSAWKIDKWLCRAKNLSTPPLLQYMPKPTESLLLAPLVHQISPLRGSRSAIPLVDVQANSILLVEEEWAACHTEIYRYWNVRRGNVGE